MVYTKRQLQEAINYWQRKLHEIDNMQNEATDIADPSMYLSNMSKTFADKAWFVDKIPDEIDTFVDFGGGAGEFCDYISAKLGGRKLKYIVIDFNKQFLKAAEQKGYLGFCTLDELQDSGVDLSHAMLFLSSVIHEIYSYSDPFYDDPGYFWSSVNRCGFPFIAIRDMAIGDANYKNCPIEAVKWIYANVFMNDAYEVKGVQLSKLLDSFEDEWGAIVDMKLGKVNVKNLVHFMIKYRYVENWEREVKENYLPLSQDRLFSILTKRCGYQLEKQQTKLPYWLNTWTKDFKLNRPSPNNYKSQFRDWIATWNTHIKITGKKHISKS